MNLNYIPEPFLYFNNNKKCIDPKIGLLKHGPNGLTEDNQEIQLGVVGSINSIIETKLFLNRLENGIQGVEFPDTRIRGIDFPGVDKGLPLGYYFKFDEAYSESIPNDILTLMNSDEKRTVKITEAAKAFEQALKDLSGIHPTPDIVLISIPEEILNNCCNPLFKQRRIKLIDRTYADLNRLSKLPDDLKPILIDFHHYLKVISYELNLRTQVLQHTTINFASNRQDPSTIAWNFAVANFYKATGTPWKLADLQPETIHVGISFYNDIGSESKPVVRAAIAQVYMKTGDSQIIRGIEIPLKEEEDRVPCLTEEQSSNILKQAISLYKRQHDNKSPYRVILHKKSPYSEEEMTGFQASCEGIVKKDFIHIYERTNLRILTPSKYPVIRGTVLSNKHKGKEENYIYTYGYIPAFATYPGSSVPSPIRVGFEKTDSSAEQISLDILNLTKLDWNSAKFASRLPVTVSVSSKVGEILGEMKLYKTEVDPPASYSYYM